MSKVAVTVIGERTEPLFRSASVGDRVTIVTPHGNERTGRVVMKFSSHLVLNLGGAHGTPGIADDSNTIRVNKRTKQ
jgi:hypothetical protein